MGADLLGRGGHPALGRRRGGRQALWEVARFTAVSAVFLVVMVAFGVVASPLAALIVPVAVLSGMATATVTAAFAATQDSDSGWVSSSGSGSCP